MAIDGKISCPEGECAGLREKAVFIPCALLGRKLDWRELVSTGSLPEHLGRLAVALKSFPVVLFLQDRELRYTWVYNAFPGLSPEEMLGKTDAELIAREDAEVLMRFKREALDGFGPRRAVLRMTCPRRAHYYQWWLHPLRNENGAVEGLAGLAIETPGRIHGEARASLLASLSRSFAETEINYPAVLDTVVRLVAQTAGDACYIGLIDDERRIIALAAFAHTDPALERACLALHDALPEEERGNLIPESFVKNGAQRIDNLMAREDLLARFPAEFRRWLRANPIYAVMVLPLRTPRAMLGVLTVWRSSSREPYSADDQIFWQDVVDRAALAIENARLYAEEVRRNRQLNALHDATRALLTTLDLEELLGRILDAAQTAIPAAERGVLYLVARGTGQLEVRATSGFKDPRIRRTGQLDSAHARRAMRERRPLLVTDVTLPEGEDLNQDEDAFRSAILAPLVLGEEVLGMLSLSSAQPQAFTASDLEMLTSFAATTTTALNNAMLHAELQKIAITDSLTGLYNRRGLLALGRHEIERFHRYGSPVSVIMLDIDNFKVVNDTYGHAAGDQVLCRLAERCRRLIRVVDILGRYGGEEFAAILPGTDLFQAAEIAERLRAAVADEPFSTDPGPVSITVSIGVSRTGPGSVGLDEVIERADAALYRAKQAGRNRVEIG